MIGRDFDRVLARARSGDELAWTVLYSVSPTRIPAGEGPAVPSGLIGFALLGAAVAMVAARRGQAVAG